MPLPDEIKELYGIEDNPALRGEHYLMHGVLEEVLGSPSLNDEEIQGVVAILTGENGFFDVRDEKRGKSYFVAYPFDLPCFVLADSDAYGRESMDRPIFRIEGVSVEEDRLYLEKLEPNLLLVRGIVRLLDSYLGSSIEAEELEPLP